MDTLLNLCPGQWSLLVLPRSMRVNILVGLGHLAENNPLLVLDGGNQFNAYIVARAVRGRQEILDRIRVSRAFTCYQLVEMLESLAASPSPIICLDFLSTFFDESLPLRERQRLLESCLPHLARLSQPFGLLLSVSQPKVMLPEASAFLDILQDNAADIWMAELPVPPLEPLRLF